MRVVVAAIAAALAFALPAAAAPPGAGVLVPGRSLGGLQLGATKAEVEQRWGRAYGVCRNCVFETWYFNYYAFQPRGVSVEWRQGRVVGLFTIYQPLGWRTHEGPRAERPRLPDHRHVRAAEDVRLRRLLRADAHPRNTVTAFYVLGDRLWAFGLSRPSVALCR